MTRPLNHRQHVVPDSGQWEYRSFSELAEFKNGLNFSGNDIGSGVKLIGVSDFWNAFSIDYDDLPRVAVPESIDPSYFLKDGDLLFVRSNGNKALIGRVLYIHGVNELITHSGFTIRARVISPDILPVFAAYYFTSPLVKKQFYRLGGGTNISNLSQSVLESVVFPIPPHDEQRSIVHIFDRWRKATDQTTRLLKLNRRFKRALMRQLLTGRRRFPEFAGEPWREYRLGDLFTERCEQARSDLKLLSISAGRGVVPREMMDRRDSSSEDKRLYLRIAPGDMGYNTMRMWQGVSALSTMEGIVSPAYTICVPNEQIDGRFAAHLFKHRPIIHLFWRHSQGMVDDTLNLKFHHFSQIKITIPSTIAEQEKIAAVLNCCDREIDLLEQQLVALREQKKGLMQKLLTGAVRIKVSKEES